MDESDLSDFEVETRHGVQARVRTTRDVNTRLAFPVAGHEQPEDEQR